MVLLLLYIMLYINLCQIIYITLYIWNITVLLLASAFFDLEEHSNEPHYWEESKSSLLALGSNIFPKLYVMRLGGSNHQLVVTPSSRLKSMTHLLHLRYIFSYRTESDMTNFKRCLLRKPLIPREEWRSTDSRRRMGTTHSRGRMGDYKFQGGE